MREKGFTLIELLAVIVVLAIIALIATPIILGIIKDAQNQANERSKELYRHAVDIAITQAQLEGEIVDGAYEIDQNGNIVYGDTIIEVDVENPPTSGTVLINKGNAELVSIDGKISKQEAGLYDEDFNLVASWDELIDAGLDIVSNTQSTEVYNEEEDAYEEVYPNAQMLSNYSNGKILVIPDSVTRIGVSALYDSELTNIIIPSSVKNIGGNAFAHCNNLVSIYIPDSVTSMGNGVFGSDENLSDVRLSKSLTEIPGTTFINCFSLKSIVIPANITGIETFAFVTTGSSLPLNSVIFEDPSGWTLDGTPVSVEDLSDPGTAASLIRSNYAGIWRKQ